MLVWIFQSGEPIHSDSGEVRPMRAINLSHALIKRNHKVVLWTSAFYHQERFHRSRVFKRIKYNENLQINLIPSIGYKKNIGLGRLIDHAHLAINLIKELSKPIQEKPNIAFIGYPPIETAAVLTFWLKRNNIFTFLDIKDQWPSLFVEAFPKFLKPISKVFLSPYYFLGRKSILNASAITSTSEGYTAWALNFAKREKNCFDTELPLVSQKLVFSDKEMQLAKKWWQNKDIDLEIKNKFCFVGNINYSYDFSLIKEAAEYFQDKKTNCQFIICGKGDQFEELKKLFEGLSNTFFPGWVNQIQTASLMKGCVASIAPYKDIKNFNTNLTNKFIDSFSNNLPVLTNLTGEIKRIYEKEKVILFCRPTRNSWVKGFDKLLTNSEIQKEMANNCKKMYENNFTFESVYNQFVGKMELINKNETLK